MANWVIEFLEIKGLSCWGIVRFIIQNNSLSNPYLVILFRWMERLAKWGK